MSETNEKSKDRIVDFIDDEEYYTVRKYKHEIEKGSWAIYIFSTFQLLSFIFYLMLHYTDIKWLDVCINAVSIILYFLLGYYSHYKPFTSFVGVLCLLAFFTLLQVLFFPVFNLYGIVVKSTFVVFISMRLKMAKIVEQYESKKKQ